MSTGRVRVRRVLQLTGQPLRTASSGRLAEPAMLRHHVVKLQSLIPPPWQITNGCLVEIDLSQSVRHHSAVSVACNTRAEHFSYMPCQLS